MRKLFVAILMIFSILLVGCSSQKVYDYSDPIYDFKEITILVDGSKLDSENFYYLFDQRTGLEETVENGTVKLSLHRLNSISWDTELKRVTFNYNDNGDTTYEYLLIEVLTYEGKTKEFSNLQ